MEYHFYMGTMLCPVAPSKLQLKIGNNNKTMTLINEGEVNILKQAGLTDISFDLLLPNVKYPFAMYKSGFVTADYFLNEFERLKTNKKPFQFIVTRAFPNGKLLFSTNMTVSLESYEIKEDAKQGFDVVVSIKLKQYKDYGTKTCEVNLIDSTLYITPTRSSETSPKNDLPKLHLVWERDTLSTLSKYYYGDYDHQETIRGANKESLTDEVQYTSVLPLSTVLTIPALEES